MDTSGIVAQIWARLSGRTQKYDLPLNRDSGAGFVVLMIALMTFLSVMCLAALLTLSHMTASWRSGLENRITVEIPVNRFDGTLRDTAALKAAAERIADILSNAPGVDEAAIMPEAEIARLVEPWLGSDRELLASLPLPALISVTLGDAERFDVARAENSIRAIVPEARIDTHSEWLSAALGFIRSLSFAGYLLAVIIGVTTVTAVSGAVRSRMAVHSAEIELLHLMGAGDGYIAGQFQRHTLIMALQGGAAGTLAGVAAILLIRLFDSRTTAGLLPPMEITGTHIAAFCALPLGIALICVTAARMTVVRVLEQLP